MRILIVEDDARGRQFLAKGLRENGYWMAVLMNAFFNKTDPADVLTYESRVGALTAAELKDAAKRYFDTNNYVQVVLYPAK